MSCSTTLNAADLRRIVRGVRAFGSRPGLRRHIWTAGELQELCRAYIQHSRQIPLWKIAEMLHTTFSYPKHDICESDEAHVPPPQRAPGYAAVPSIPAITAKLVNCIYLETGGELGYTNMKPSELQTQVWEHLLQSRQHHAMIQAMKSSSLLQCQSTPIKAEQHQDESALRVAPGAPVKPKFSTRSRIGHVRPRDSDDEEEFKTEQPPTKRRKIIFDDDDEVASETPTEIQTYTPTARATAEAAAESESSIHFNEVADALSEIEQEISQENHNNPADATCGLDMMYSDDSDDYDVYNDPDNSYNMHYDNMHYEQQVHVDFFSEAAQSWFQLKYLNRPTGNEEVVH
jgi:hypothetical protein